MSVICDGCSIELKPGSSDLDKCAELWTRYAVQPTSSFLDLGTNFKCKACRKSARDHYHDPNGNKFCYDVDLYATYNRGLLPDGSKCKTCGKAKRDHYSGNYCHVSGKFCCNCDDLLRWSDSEGRVYAEKACHACRGRRDAWCGELSLGLAKHKFGWFEPDMLNRCCKHCGKTAACHFGIPSIGVPSKFCANIDDERTRQRNDEAEGRRKAWEEERQQRQQQQQKYDHDSDTMPQFESHLPAAGEEECPVHRCPRVYQFAWARFRVPRPRK